MKKTTIKIIASAVAATVTVGAFAAAFVGCGKKPNYFEKVSAYSFWENTGETSIPQYNVYNIVNDFLSDGEIRDGQVIGKDGKVKKVAFFGFDGTRADAISNVLFDENSFDTNGYNYAAEKSGLNELVKTGGIYLAYCGGEKSSETEQSTSTSASWTSQFTGVWNNKHGVKENDDVKNMEYKTFMLQYAEKGLKTSLAFDWGDYFDINLREEVKYLMENPDIDFTVCDTDRKTETAAPENMLAENLDLYNFVANPTPSDKAPYDVYLRDYLLGRIEGGDDIVCGIFHNVDSNGHTYGFSNEVNQYVNSVRNCDGYAYDLIKAIEKREKENNEEWLIIIANDHGGKGQGHGEQTYEERTTWIASNKKIDSKYFSQNYDGFKVK